ncbi:MAG: hypothetical protein JO096_01585, partial [Alphaproteobacteria bacterium]|nr:hypothetical protein [Alphaproteobacteria bacterium]
VPVYVLAEDLDERGLGPGDILNGVERISREDLPRLLGSYDQIWHW